MSPVSRLLMPMLISIVVMLSLAGSVTMFPARFCDFRAFYCSGRAVLTGQDPYREHPLHECEHALPGPFVSYLPAQVTIPAPYPGFALELFSLMARLPFNVAVIIWTLCSCAALGVAVILASRITATPLYATAIVLGLPAAIVPLPLGQPTLFVLLALLSCATLLRAERPRLSVLAALVTLVDPHVGLAVCTGLFAAVPRARLPLLLGVSALEATSLAAFGFGRELEYVREVLPLHALVNVPEFSQFSVANLLYTMGLAPKLALAFGNFWYVAAVVTGVIVGLRLRTTYGVVAAMFFPVAFAVFGGSHTHLQQLALAIPAFLLVTSTATGIRRTALGVTTFTASIPWLISAASPLQFIAVGVLGIAFARSMAMRFSFVLGAASFTLLLALCAMIVTSHASYVPSGQQTIGNPLAEVAWGRYVLASGVPLQWWFIVGKLPTLLAFLTMLTVLLRAALVPAKQTLPRPDKMSPRSAIPIARR